MSDFLEDFVSVITSFAAALIGIIGYTWDAKKKGLARITWTGRIALFLALIGLYSTIQQSFDKHKHIMKTRQLNIAAAMELDDELDELIEPFLILMLTQGDSTIRKHGVLWVTKAYDDYTFFDSLIRQQLMKDDKIERMNYYSTPNKMIMGPSSDNLPIWRIFSQMYTGTKANVDNTLANFSLFVSEDDRLDTYKLFSSNPTENRFFKFITKSLPIIAAEDRLQDEEFGSFFWAYLYDTDSSNKKKSFFHILGELKKRLLAEKNATP